MRVRTMSAPFFSGPRALPRPRPGNLRDLGPVRGERIVMERHEARALSHGQCQCAVISLNMRSSFDSQPYASTTFRREG
jgi:hypothetical protein